MRNFQRILFSSSEIISSVSYLKSKIPSFNHCLRRLSHLLYFHYKNLQKEITQSHIDIKLEKLPRCHQRGNFMIFGLFHAFFFHGFIQRF